MNIFRLNSMQQVSIQLHKCVTWSPFGLMLNLNVSSQFNNPLERIVILGFPLDTSSFTSSFIKYAMLEDVQHIVLFPKLYNVQVAFRILTRYFMQ